VDDTVTALSQSPSHHQEDDSPVTEPGGPEGRNERDEPHEEEAGDQATAEEEEEEDSGEWAAEEDWRRREQCRECTYEEDEEVPATEAGGSEGSNECVSADRDEELSDVQVSDAEDRYERSERRFRYNPDNGDLWAEYQAVMGDDWFAW